MESIATGNLFENIPKQLPEELVSILLNQAGLRVERIVSRGHSSAEDYWYQQEEDEWIFASPRTGSTGVSKASQKSTSKSR